MVLFVVFFPAADCVGAHDDSTHLEAQEGFLPFQGFQLVQHMARLGRGLHQVILILPSDSAALAYIVRLRVVYAEDAEVECRRVNRHEEIADALLFIQTSLPQRIGKSRIG